MSDGLKTLLDAAGKSDTFNKLYTKKSGVNYWERYCCDILQHVIYSKLANSGEVSNDTIEKEINNLAERVKAGVLDVKSKVELYEFFRDDSILMDIGACLHDKGVLWKLTEDEICTVVNSLSEWYILFYDNKRLDGGLITAVLLYINEMVGESVKQDNFDEFDNWYENCKTTLNMITSNMLDSINIPRPIKEAINMLRYLDCHNLMLYYNKIKKEVFGR